MLFKCFIRIYFISCLVISHSLAQPKLWNIPIVPSKFIGRHSYMKTIEAEAKKRPVLLSGLSGIGKTSLAFHYIRTHNNQYDIAWKFDARKDMETQVVEFAKQIVELDSLNKRPNYFDAKECLEFIKEYLRKTTYQWILVFDDAKSYSDVVKFFPETHGAPNKQIIITSLTTRSLEQAMRITKFTLEETVEFLKHHLGEKTDENHCRELGEVLDFHPLALRQAVSFLRFTPGSSIPDYISYFKSKNKEFWEAERVALANDNIRNSQQDLYTSIKISLDKLRNENPVAHELLCALSQIDFSQIDDVFIKCWIEKFADGRSDVFGHLLDSALVDQSKESDSTSGYTIHSYIQAVVMSDASDAEKIKSSESVEKLLFSMLSGPSDIVFEYFENNPFHVAHLKTFSEARQDIQTDEFLDLNVKLLYYSFYAQRRYEFADKQAMKISRSLAKKSFNNALMVASFHNTNSYMRYISEGLPEAIEETLKAYKILKKIDSSDARKEMIILLSNNLGYYYYWQGNLKGCDRCCKEASELLENNDDPLMNVLVDILKIIIFVDRGRFNEAESLIIHLKSYSENNSFLKRVTGHYQKTLHAMIALKKNNNGEARRLAISAHEDAIETAEGNNMLEIAGRPCPHWSIAESRLGNFEEAERVARMAIHIFDATYLSTHKNRQQANSHFALAIALQGQQKYDEALDEFMLAKEIYSKIFVNLRVDDVSDLYFRIVELGIILKDELLVQEHVKQHIEIFGLDNPRSIEMSKITS